MKSYNQPVLVPPHHRAAIERIEKEGTYSAQKAYTGWNPLQANICPVLTRPCVDVCRHICKRKIRDTDVERAGIPYKSPSPRRVRQSVIHVLRGLHNQLRQMAIKRAQIPILFNATILSLHRVSMPMHELVEKCPPGFLICIWELGPLVRRARVKKITVTFLNGAIAWLHVKSDEIVHLGDGMQKIFNATR